MVGGTYEGLSNHGLAQSCRENSATLSMVQVKHGTALFMLFLKARLIDVLEHCYSMIDRYVDLNDADFLKNVEHLIN